MTAASFPPLPGQPGARLPVALIGAGAIGRMHAERLLRHPDVSLAAIADPGPAAQDFAAHLGLRCFSNYLHLLDELQPRAAIIATPNAQHIAMALACLERGIVPLVEKPVADTVAEARRLVDASAATGIPVLVGHHRRHNPILRTARELVDAGALGRPVAATAMATWLKPDAYFEPAWRRAPGAGPVLINLIHDVDMLRHLLGEVVQVQAMASNAQRGFAVEDTAAATLRFANGALGTLMVSDAAVSPWNWDLGAGEAAHYAQQAVDSHYIAGSEGALTLPRLELWRYRGARGWHEPLTQERSAPHAADPYMEQLRHLRAVVERREAPRCSALDGLRTLEVTRAVLDSAASGQLVNLPAAQPAA
ncbi:MAG: hypothetical protein RIQ60_704 [Pseudomonadota bacterium]|jgi:predicted dehydrogenase